MDYLEELKLRELNGLQVELEEEKRSIKQKQRELEAEKKEFERKQKAEEQRLLQEKKLFEMKWKILEEELKQVAAEKKRVEMHRAFYKRVKNYEDSYNTMTFNSKLSFCFFNGIDNELALKKRYRDLIKIFHPDNLNGDTDTIQEINREYDQLRRNMCV